MGETFGSVRIFLVFLSPFVLLILFFLLPAFLDNEYNDVDSSHYSQKLDKARNIEEAMTAPANYDDDRHQRQQHNQTEVTQLSRATEQHETWQVQERRAFVLAHMRREVLNFV